jgi:hypothetical protein
MSQFPNNSPLADFLCGSCSEEFELKSQKSKFGAKVADGAYKTKCERLAASNNPNLLLMNYDLKSLSVVNLLIVQNTSSSARSSKSAAPWRPQQARTIPSETEAPHLILTTASSASISTFVTSCSESVLRNGRRLRRRINRATARPPERSGLILRRR